MYYLTVQDARVRNRVVSRAVLPLKSLGRNTSWPFPASRGSGNPRCCLACSCIAAIVSGTYSQRYLSIKWEVMNIRARHTVGWMHDKILSSSSSYFNFCCNYCYVTRPRRSHTLWGEADLILSASFCQSSKRNAFLGDNFCFLTNEGLWSQLKLV